MRRNRRSKLKAKSLLARTVESFKARNFREYQPNNILTWEFFAKTFDKNFDRNQSLKIFSYHEKNTENDNPDKNNKSKAKSN